MAMAVNGESEIPKGTEDAEDEGDRRRDVEGGGGGGGGGEEDKEGEGGGAAAGAGVAEGGVGGGGGGERGEVEAMTMTEAVEAGSKVEPEQNAFASADEAPVDPLPAKQQQQEPVSTVCEDKNQHCVPWWGAAHV